jgi:aminopeptidase N
MTKNIAALLVVCLGTLAGAQQLPRTVLPENYQLTLSPNFQTDKFEGDETIQVQVAQSTSKIMLNAAELTFGEATVTQNGSTQTAQVATDPKSETATLTVPQALAAGPATIHIHYTGILNNELRGFYLSQVGNRKYGVTQFEPADARRAYASFDQPDMKATFDLTVVVDKGDMAISNGKVVSDTPGPGTDKHTVKFSTTPKMSSYLLALAVGEFQCEAGQADGIPIGVCGTPEQKGRGHFALQAAEYSLSYYDRYFGIKYPYGKLDFIGAPDFAAGAMENTGCIIARDLLLFVDPNSSSYFLQKAVAQQAVAHEMAHQWFGDLVTMKWWDDVWLNEGFATWMSNKPVEAWKPEWNFDLDVVTDTGNTLSLDSLANTRPIHQAAETRGQIEELFDGIAYGKAASVLRMLEAYLGEETFRTGVNAYLKQHQYANATADDFWTTQAQVSKKPVDQIMPTFVKQAGEPIIELKSQCSGTSTSVALSQRRYYSDRLKFEAPNDQVWQIPLCLKDSAGKGREKCEQITAKASTLTMPGCSTWVLGNAGATGYYRMGYDPDAVRALAQDAESKLSPAERIALDSDVWASVKVGREPVGDYLALAQGLQPDRNRAVLDNVLTRLDYIGQYLVNDNDRDNYRAWLRQYLTPIAKEVGWDPKPGESDEQRALRARLLNALGYDARDQEVLAEARKLADKALNDPASVDHGLAQGALSLAALNGDESFYDRVMAALKTAKSPEEYYIFFTTLRRFDDPKLLQRTLDFAITSDVRSQDSMQLITGVLRNPAGQKLAWNFVQEHWETVEKAGGPFAGVQVIGATSNFCDAHMRDQVVDFFATHKVDGGERTYRQSIERINNCVDLKSQQEPQLAAWLGQHGAAGGK